MILLRTNFLFITPIILVVLVLNSYLTTNSKLVDCLAPASINTQLLGSLSPLFIEQLSNKLNLNQSINGISTQNFTSTPTSVGNNRTNTYQKLQLLARGPLLQAANLTTANNSRRQAIISEPTNLQPPLKLTQQRQNLQVMANNMSLPAVRQRWRQMELSVGESMNNFANQLQTTLDELNQKSIVNGQQVLSLNCRSSLNELLDGLANQKLWAGQAIDASARLPSGLLEGTLTELGNFDQCLGINYPSSSSMSQPTSGQYCSVQIKPPLIPRVRLHTICQKLPALSASSNNNQSSKIFRLLSQNSHHFYYAGLRLGLCTPSKCSKNDVQLLLNSYLAKFELLGQVKSCQVLASEQELKLDYVQQCVASALIILLLLVLLGTIVDLATGGVGDSSKGVDQLITKIQTIDSTDNQMLNINSAASSSSSGSTEQQLGNRRAPRNGKRWLYQVYRSPPTACQLHGNYLSPGMQRNPLASEVDLSVGDSGNQLDIKGGQILGGQFSTLHSRPDLNLDECHLADNTHASAAAAEQDEVVMMEEVMIEDEEEEEEEEEEEDWIAQLERNQAQINLSQVGNNINLPLGEIPSARKRRQHLPKQLHNRNRRCRRNQDRDRNCSRRLEFRALAKATLICFSLRSNLRLIGKHVANSSSGSGNGNKQEQQRTSAATGTIKGAGNELADIKVIHGLRTITMIWIIFGHTIGLVNPEMMNNLFSLAQLSCSSRILQALLNATLAVNTFFMISGLVTVVSLVRKCASANKLLCSNNNNNSNTNQHDSSKNRQQQKQQEMIATSGGCNQHINHDLESSSIDSVSSIISSLGSSNKCIGSGGKSSKTSSSRSNGDRRKREQAKVSRNKSQKNTAKSWPNDFQPFIWLTMRYLRLTPAYATIIGVSILMPLMGSGPFWQESAGSLGAACRENWWTNLLYANNFINTDKLCLIHSWYLSNDWQFFLVTILLLTIGYKSKRLALLVLVTLIIGSSAATFALTVSNDFPPTIVSTSPAVAERWLFIHSLYYKPWPHLSSYLIGLITGYMLIERDSIKMSKLARSMAWLAVTILAFALLNSIYPWNMGLQVEPLITGLHSATFRTLWSACCAWLVFALATRPQTPMAKLFGWHGFQVSSRLTYCAYLVHPLIIYYHFGTLRERMDSSMYGQFHRFMATLALSYLFALLLSLVVESPTIQLQRLIISNFFSSSNFRSGSGSKSISGATRHHHRESSCSGTSESWIGTSSFGEQSSATSSNLALVSGADHHHLNKTIHQQCCHPIDSQKQQANNNNNIHQQQQSSTSVIWNNDNPSAVAAAAMDADFQRKLAQAISRGFRLRSKMANNQSGTIKPNPIIQSSGNMTAAAAATKPKQQMKKTIATPIVESAQMELNQQEQFQRSNQQHFVVKSSPIDHNHLNQHKPSATKKVEFSTFFVSPQTPQIIANQNEQQQQQLATAAVAERQRRRSHDLMMINCKVPQPPMIPVTSQQQHQPIDNNEMILLRQQAANLTRSQNQLDQCNPRTGQERI